MNDIFCAGDGFAHGHIWPEWPQVLQALLPDDKVHVLSGIGSGNEFLISKLLQHDVRDRTVIFQWADARRFDKIIEDQQWNTIAKSDPIYHFNFYQDRHHTWWLSSASQNKDVRLYHDFYVQEKQSRQRMLDQKKLLAGYLTSQNCLYLEISTEQQETYSKESRFKHVRGDQIQPSPVVHFMFVKEILLPKLRIVVDKHRTDCLERLLSHHCWKPYDPDRVEIWSDMIKDLDIGPCSRP